MKRVLGLSSIPVDEGIGAGADRIANLYRHLPDRYERTLVTLTGLRRGGGGELDTGSTRVVRVPSPSQTLFHYLQRFRIAPFFRVAGLHRSFPFRAAPWLTGEYDLVQFDSLWLTPWADRLPGGTPVVYASHNYETDWYEGEIRRFLFRRRHARALAELERRAVLRADRVLAVTDEDREKFVAVFGADRDRIAVVPNGYDDTRFRPPSEKEKTEARRKLGLPPDRKIALFAGSNVSPNRDAVDSILRVVAPQAKDLVFVVAGSVGEAYRGGGGENVIFTGRVDDILPWFHAADVGLNPIRLGSGSNIKVLQYLGSGLAVLSTSFGMRGFDDLVGHVKVARIDRFHYHAGRIEPDGAAEKAVRERYSWRGASTALAEVYSALLDGAPPRGDQKTDPKSPSEGRNR